MPVFCRQLTEVEWKNLAQAPRASFELTNVLQQRSLRAGSVACPVSFPRCCGHFPV
jgi:hypothetical protein